MPSEKRLYKARELKYALYREIRKNGWGPHHQLPSERVLAERFEVNAITVRKAFREMVAEGAIYQVERVGSFVSPGTRLGQILFVTPTWWDFHLTEFFRAFANEIRGRNENVLPVLVAEPDFMAHLDDLESVFRDVTFVVFFRSPRNFALARPILEKKEIPHCFYGSDAYEGLLGDANRMVYDERNIARLAFHRLGKEKRGPLACLYAKEVPITVHRFGLFRETCAEEGLPLEDSLVLEVETGRSIWGENRFGVQKEDGTWTITSTSAANRARTGRFLRAAADRRAAIFLPVDGLAMRIHQAAAELGIRIPEDVRTVSVDNMDFSEYLACPLTTIEIRVYVDAQRLFERMMEYARERGPAFRMQSEVRLLERRSG